MKRERKPLSFRSQVSLLAHIYKVEILELCQMTGLWLVCVIEELATLAWSIAYYDIRHQRRHR